MRWAWEAFQQDREDEAKEEGILIGKRSVILNLLGKLGNIPESLEERIRSETEAVKLDAMSMIVAKATSVLEFEEQISKL